MTLHRANLGSQAYDALKAMILEGHFAPGARITVEQLAKQLGVSRTPVWEAVAHLAREGLVVNLPHRGVYVAVLSPRDVLDLYAVREVTEALAAKLAAERMEPAALAAMEANLERQGAALAACDLETYSALDAEFHGIVCAQCGNRPLQEVLHSIRDKIWPLKVPVGALLPQLYRDHQDLLAALRARLPDQAEAAVRRHVHLIMETIANTLDMHAR